MGSGGEQTAAHILPTVTVQEESCSGFRTKAEDKRLCRVFFGLLEAIASIRVGNSRIPFSHHVHVSLQVASVITCLSRCLRFGK